MSIFGMPFDDFMGIVSLIAFVNNADNQQDPVKLSKIKWSFDG